MIETFKRTKKGLSNLHLFYNVDYIVYLEGGSKSFSKDEVYLDNFNDDTEDIVYWKNIFKKYKKNELLKFKSVGSKKTLKDISEDILAGKIKNVYMAMDNEFDEVYKKRITHSNIFYTHGYSYENDVWNENVIIDILKDLTASEIDEKIINEGFSKFLKDIKIGVVSDAYQFKKDQSFFPRKKGHLFCVECNTDNFPKVKTTAIEKLMEEKSLIEKTVKSFGYRYKIETLKFCFGHLLADYCCQIINYYLKHKHKLSNIRKEIIYRMGIKKFFDNHYLNSEIEEYFIQQFI